MIRVVWILVAACSSPSPMPSNTAAKNQPKRQPPKLEGLDDEQRCAAVAERTLPCIDEVFNAALISTTGIDWSKERPREKRMDPAEGRKVHELGCRVGPSYSDAIVTCWNERTCQAFGACVERHNQIPPRPPADEPEPLRLDP